MSKRHALARPNHGEVFIPFGNFVNALVPVSLCASTTISSGAKLLYGRLALYSGKNGQCNPKIETLAQDLGAPVTTVKRWLAELVDEGLIRRIRGGQGQSATCHFLWNDLLAGSLFNSPKMGYQPTTLDSPDLVRLDGPDLVHQRSLIAQNDALDSPDLVHALKERKGSEKVLNTLLSEIDTQAASAAVKPADIIAVWFAEEFWPIYPRHDGKVAALKAARSKGKTQTVRTEIIAGLNAQLPEFASREKRFIPLAATWLNGERWSDEPMVPPDAGRTQRLSDRRALEDAEWNRILERLPE